MGILQLSGHIDKIGRTGWIALYGTNGCSGKSGPVRVHVIVEDVRANFDRIEYKCRVIDGSGYIWVVKINFDK